MGNVHSFAHRVTALSMACLSSAGVIFCFLSGFSCHFLKIKALPDQTISTPSGLVFAGETTANCGIQCESPFYDASDRMWNLSRVFLYIALALGCMTTLLAWSLGTCVTPTNTNWRLMYILAACTAVLEVPIFLMFESEPCNMDVSRQTCSLGLAGYFGIVSIALFVFMTLWTQCLNPPDWRKEETAWRNEDRDVKVCEITIPSGEDNATDEESNPQTAALPHPFRNRVQPAWGTSAGKGRCEIVKEQDDSSDLSSISEDPVRTQVKSRAAVNSQLAHSAKESTKRLIQVPNQQQTLPLQPTNQKRQEKVLEESAKSKTRNPNKHEKTQEMVLEESATNKTRNPNKQSDSVNPFARCILGVRSAPKESHENVGVPPIELGVSGSIMNEKNPTTNPVSVTTSVSENSRSRAGTSRQHSQSRDGKSAGISSFACGTEASTRKSFLSGSGYSSYLRDNGDIKVTIVCPNGSKEQLKAALPACTDADMMLPTCVDEDIMLANCSGKPIISHPCSGGTNLIPTCTDGTTLLESAQQTIIETAEFVRSASKLTRQGDILQAQKEGEDILKPGFGYHGDDEYVRSIATDPRDFEQDMNAEMPLSSLAITKTDYENDAVSEMTPAFSQYSTPGRTENFYKATLCTLDDLAQMER